METSFQRVSYSFATITAVNQRLNKTRSIEDLARTALKKIFVD